MNDNERITKRLGWCNRNNVSEWYSTPDGARLTAPPLFHLDTKVIRDVWRGIRGVLETLVIIGLLEAFSEALKAQAIATHSGNRIMSVKEFGVFCLLATPAELTAAFVRMLDEEEPADD